MLHEISAFYKISQKSHQPLFATKKTTKYRAMPLEERRPPKRNAVLRWKHRTNRFVFPRDIAAHLVSAFATANVVVSAPCPRCIVLKRAVFHFFFFSLFFFVPRLLLDSPRPLPGAVFKNSRNILTPRSRGKCTIDELNVKSGWVRRGRVNARYRAFLGQLYAKA